MENQAGLIETLSEAAHAGWMDGKIAAGLDRRKTARS